MNAWPNKMMRLLRRMTLFADLSDDKLEDIIQNGSREQYKAGSIVFHFGDQGDTFYIIESGQVEVQIQSGDTATPVTVDVLGIGECFGEMALITNEPRSATIRVSKDATMLKIRREDFSNLVSDVTFYHRLVNLMCLRLRQTSHRLEEAQRARMALSHYLRSHPTTQEEQLTGSSTHTRHLAEAVQAAANSDGPVLIEGKQGTGKSYIAALIVRGGNRAEGPMVTIDCTENEDVTPSEIFGSEAGTLPNVGNRQMGALELCAEGTVVIAEPQKISLTSQERLKQAIESGKFRRIGGDQDIPLRTRIIITQGTNGDSSASWDGDEINSLFTGGHIQIPTLDQRRRDIPEIAEAILQKHCHALGRSKPEISHPAMEKLLAYDWPGNIDELDTVIRRTIMLSSNGSIEADHILIHLPPSRNEGKFNLFQIPWLLQFVKSRWYPTVFQIPTVAVLGLIIYLCFFGPQDDSNLALSLTWPIWWAALPLSFLFLGRVWCTICPFSLISSIVQRFHSFRLKVPTVFHKTEIWPMTALFIFLTWADGYWHYPEFPTYTGAVLVFVFAGSLIFSTLFEHRTWCRYFCPLGGVNGVYASAGLVELRANTDMCAYQCRSHNCIAHDSKLACPMLEKPLAVETNRNCNICMNCVKACRNDAIHLYLRKPGAEMWEMQKHRLSAGVLAVLLVGTMLIHAVGFYLHGHGLELEGIAPAVWLRLSSEASAWTVDYFLALVIPLAVMMVASAFSARREGKAWKDNLAHYGLSFAVMALLMHIILEGGEFIEEGIPLGISLVGNLFGSSLPPETYNLFTPLFVRIVQLGLAISAIMLTMYIILRIAKRRCGDDSTKGAGLHLATAAVMGLIFLGLIALTPLGKDEENKHADSTGATVAYQAGVTMTNVTLGVDLDIKQN